MTAIDQTSTHADPSETEKNALGTSCLAAGLPSGANPPHMVFPPSATFSTETPLAELDAIRLDVLPSDSDPPSMLDRVARENLLATGAVPPPLAVAGASSNPTSTRRPLSELVAAEPDRQETFQAALEVDRYRWPAVCERLADPQTRVLDTVVEGVREAVEGGHAMIGFLGAEPRSGCTTILLSVARRLAASGSRIAMVDADFATAALENCGEPALDLASQLGLEVTVSWEDVLAGRVPLAEGVIASTAEPIAVLPLKRRPHSAEELLQVIQTHGIQASVTAGVLREHYDVVLVDLGCVAEPVQVSTVRAIVQHCRLDVTLIVAREPVASSDFPSSRVLTSTAKTVCLGVVENWAEAA